MVGEDERGRGHMEEGKKERSQCGNEGVEAARKKVETRGWKEKKWKDCNEDD